MVPEDLRKVHNVAVDGEEGVAHRALHGSSCGGCKVTGTRNEGALGAIRTINPLNPNGMEQNLKRRLVLPVEEQNLKRHITVAYLR